ncbi:FHA domain-containing protein [Acinetobacter sp. ANC 4173]|uniref:FHA domain-containing protein n=1 Tax=Acinetobacter sp. ANC 4173 TaxID=2529837 RepID=UPI001039BFD7|nr:FHA domain-containing protein [Acinetobacter sp. ANC 4173]TCB82108.1 FHA domain-containing protein [Acinetobacter sp. ANC 4173]
MTWKIQAITGEFTGQEINIDRDMLVGRHQDADVLLQSAEVSRKHAALLLKEQALWVQDLNSSNGTFVNEAKIENESQLQDGDVVQFASFKFAVFAPAPAVETVEQEEIEVQQPAEAVAPSETAAEKSAAQHMNEQGMPSLTERDGNVQLTRDGMPQNVSVPKPAPIPEGIDLSQVTPEPEPVPVEQPVSRVEEERTQQKNASLGLITIIVLVILAILTWVMFK